MCGACVVASDEGLEFKIGSGIQGEPNTYLCWLQHSHKKRKDSLETRAESY